MDLKIFDVEHGACALLTCDDNTRLMIDAGHNAASQWRPGTYLKGEGITTLDMLAITNYDEDHVSGLPNLVENVDIRWLWRNKAVSAPQIKQLKSEDGMGVGIECLVERITNVFTGDGTSPQPTFAGLKRFGYHNSMADFDDENNLSLVVYLECHGVGVLFPGDLENAGWRMLLEDPGFKAALQKTRVLIASHHGRASGCCDEIFEFCKPNYVVISDKGYMHDTQETVPYYRAKAVGGPFRTDGTRHVLTTRNDGRIGFTFTSDSWGPY